MRVTPIQSITNMKNNTKKQLTKEDISDILKKKLNKKECMKNVEQFGKRNS